MLGCITVYLASHNVRLYYYWDLCIILGYKRFNILFTTLKCLQFLLIKCHFYYVDFHLHTVSQKYDEISDEKRDEKR